MRTLVLVATLAGLALASDAASAGWKTQVPLSMNTNSWPEEASGVLGDVRNSGDTQAYIGCQAAAYPGTGVAVCYARSSAGYRTCYSYDPGIVARARTVGPDSYVDFRWDSTGVCNFLLTAVNSDYTPMTP
jgi:hypothetical protein